jgi:uncharacterized phage protein (TIGR01671 family)
MYLDDLETIAFSKSGLPANASIAGFSVPLTAIGAEPQLILLQFVGLHDKNGKEIYEGDILTARRARYGRGRRGPGNLAGYAEMTLECVFDVERAGFMFKNNTMGWSAAFGLEESYEVIGNIYENPKLLSANDAQV